MKKLIVSGSLVLVSLLMFSFQSVKQGKVIMIISLEVENFSDWKKGFDAGAAVRDKAGIKVLSICSSVENKNKIVVIEEAESAEASYDFVSLLKSRQKAGDMTKLNIQLFDKAE